MLTRASLVLVSCLATAAPLVLRQDAPAAERTPVAGTVSMLTIQGGGNLGVCVGPDGLVLVDDHLANTRDVVLAALREVSPEPPRFLINTHWHGDHTGNNEPLGAARVPILAHEAVRARLAGDPSVEGRTGKDTPAVALPTVTYREGLDVHLNGERIEVRHYGPGHTDGDSVVFFHGSRVVHVGDLFFHGLFPFIDTGSGGDPRGVVASLGSVLDSIGDDWKVIPGHGPLATKAELAAARDGLADCIARVEAALERGETVEEMLARGILQDYESWSWGFVPTQRFVGDLAAALAR